MITKTMMMIVQSYYYIKLMDQSDNSKSMDFKYDVLYFKVYKSGQVFKIQSMALFL